MHRHGAKPIIIEAIKAGAKDFIVKPLQSLRVLEAVNKALDMKRNTAEK